MGIKRQSLGKGLDALMGDYGSLHQDQKQDVIDTDKDEGYYDQDDFAADGEEDEDNLDALQLNED